MTTNKTHKTPNRTRPRSAIWGLLAMIALAGLILGACGSDDDSADEATTTTTDATTTTTAEATTTTEAPAEPDTSEPDLKDLSREEVVMISEAREDFIISCVANTEETTEERCILIWNCAVNEVGVAIAADPAQQPTLDEALNSCSEQIT